MNRYTMCVVGVLLGAACDDPMKPTEKNVRAAERAVAVAPKPPEVPRADDTRTNEPDRNGTVTPMDQGNSAAETTISAQIRKDVMADPSLSFTAKNVKVITMGSRVTLRGPVKTAEEKTAIGAVAMRTTGVTEIDNQLEVQP